MMVRTAACDQHSGCPPPKHTHAHTTRTRVHCLQTKLQNTMLEQLGLFKSKLGQVGKGRGGGNGDRGGGGDGGGSTDCK